MTAGMARSAGGVTRERILAVAVELFAERGFAGTSIRDISEALGMTKAALYYHFPSKEHILDAIIEPVTSRMEALVARLAAGPAPDPRDLLTELVATGVETTATLSPFMNDPSVLHSSRRMRSMKAHVDMIVAALAGPDPSPVRLLRARCAFGAVQVGVFGTIIGKIDSEQQGAPVPTLDAELRNEIVEAALAALG